MPAKYETGIVLSGGGTRGFSHLGVLQALNEAGIYPDAVSGTSAGAIAGVFYAEGYKPSEILKIFAGNKRSDYLSFTVPKDSLMEMSGLYRILNKYISSRNFKDLKIPLFVTATDLNHGKPRYFSSGELIDVIIASCSLPVLFKPIIIDDIEYLDGGIMDNFPVSPLQKKCKFLIGSHANPIGYREKLTGILSIAERTFYLSVASQIINKIGKLDLFIDPVDLKDYNILDPSKANEIYSIGYEETKRKIKPFLKKFY